MIDYLAFRIEDFSQITLDQAYFYVDKDLDNSFKSLAK